jgi:hypothetical protein
VVEDYRIEQRMPDVLHIGVSPTPTIDDIERIRSALGASIDRLGASVPTIITDGTIERGDERKCRRVRRLCGIVDA